MTSRSAPARVARLRGQLAVLLGVREELRAIGASDARLETNCDEIARVRAQLARVGDRRENGDLTDAIPSLRS